MRKVASTARFLLARAMPVPGAYEARGKPAARALARQAADAYAKPGEASSRATVAAWIARISRR